MFDRSSTSLPRGTEGSNPSSSSGESGANLIFGGESHRWPSKASIKVTGLSSSGMTTEACMLKASAVDGPAGSNAPDRRSMIASAITNMSASISLFAYKRAIRVLQGHRPCSVVSSASPEPMRFRPSHGKDAALTPLRIPLR